MADVRLELDGVSSKACGSAGLERGDFTRLVRLLSDPVQLEVIRGRSGFLDVDRHGPDWVLAAQDAIPAVPYKAVLVLGIGGSGLGTRAVWSALGDPDGDRRVLVLDNVDPHTVKTTLDSLEPNQTIVTVVSKSGTTLETLTVFLVVRAWLGAALSPEEVRSRIVVTTDPGDGPLREWAGKRGWRALPVPPTVGGRFSVLTPVGLFPLAAAGIDVAGLMAGATQCLKGDGMRDAARLAAAFSMLDTEKGRFIHVVWPYCDRLLDLGAWFLQLWAESLGKRKDGKIPVGPTPVLVRGTTDQHSQLQLYMEGPADKAFLFIALDETGSTLRTPPHVDGPDSAAYLQDRDLGEILDACRRATARALVEAGRPVATLTLGQLTAESIGYVLQLMMVATALAGTAYGVDPFDQPGVEAGKRFTRKLLGVD